MLAPFGYLNFGKRQETPAPAQQYLREKAALMAVPVALGATIQLPSWASEGVGYQPFPADRM